MLEFIAGLPPELRVFVLAAVPVIELRGAVPLGLYLGLPPLETLALAVAGNIAPVPILYYLLLPAVNYLKTTRPFRHVVTRYVARSERESRRIKRYGAAGLVLFVSIPLPVTGAWTGCLIGLLLGYSLGRTLAAITLGTVVAGSIVTVLARLAVAG